MLIKYKKQSGLISEGYFKVLLYKIQVLLVKDRLKN